MKYTIDNIQLIHFHEKTHIYQWFKTNKNRKTGKYAVSPLSFGAFLRLLLACDLHCRLSSAAPPAGEEDKRMLGKIWNNSETQTHPLWPHHISITAPLSFWKTTLLCVNFVTATPCMWNTCLRELCRLESFMIKFLTALMLSWRERDVNTNGRHLKRRSKRKWTPVLNFFKGFSCFRDAQPSQIYWLWKRQLGSEWRYCGEWNSLWSTGERTTSARSKMSHIR